jgi:hypothetical protein
MKKIKKSIFCRTMTAKKLNNYKKLILHLFKKSFKNQLSKIFFNKSNKLIHRIMDIKVMNQIKFKNSLNIKKYSKKMIKLNLLKLIQIIKLKLTIN